MALKIKGTLEQDWGIFDDYEPPNPPGGASRRPFQALDGQKAPQQSSVKPYRGDRCSEVNPSREMERKEVKSDQKSRQREASPLPVAARREDRKRHHHRSPTLARPPVTAPQTGRTSIWTSVGRVILLVFFLAAASPVLRLPRSAQAEPELRRFRALLKSSNRTRIDSTTNLDNSSIDGICQEDQPPVCAILPLLKDLESYLHRIEHDAASVRSSVSTVIDRVEFAAAEKDCSHLPILRQDVIEVQDRAWRCGETVLATIEHCKRISYQLSELRAATISESTAMDKDYGSLWSVNSWKVIVNKETAKGTKARRVQIDKTVATLDAWEEGIATHGRFMDIQNARILQLRNDTAKLEQQARYLENTLASNRSKEDKVRCPASSIEAIKKILVELLQRMFDGEI